MSIRDFFGKKKNFGTGIQEFEERKRRLVGDSNLVETNSRENNTQGKNKHEKSFREKNQKLVDKTEDPVVPKRVFSSEKRKCLRDAVNELVKTIPDVDHGDQFQPLPKTFVQNIKRAFSGLKRESKEDQGSMRDQIISSIEDRSVVLKMCHDANILMTDLSILEIEFNFSNTAEKIMTYMKQWAVYCRDDIFNFVFTCWNTPLAIVTKFSNYSSSDDVWEPLVCKIKDLTYRQIKWFEWLGNTHPEHANVLINLLYLYLPYKKMNESDVFSSIMTTRQKKIFQQGKFSFLDLSIGKHKHKKLSCGSSNSFQKGFVEYKVCVKPCGENSAYYVSFTIWNLLNEQDAVKKLYEYLCIVHSSNDKLCCDIIKQVVH